MFNFRKLVVAGALLLRRGGGRDGGAAASAIKITTVTNRGGINGAALSPDGRTVAYSLILGGQRSIRVRQVATGGDVEVLPPPQSIPPGNLTFTPDGNYLYYSSADPDRDGYTAVFEMATLGGTPRKRVYDVDSRVSFSPDGKQLCFRRGVPGLLAGQKSSAPTHGCPNSMKLSRPCRRTGGRNTSTG